MIGPLGAGKTLLARAMPGILPKMSIDEALDVTRIYSVLDGLPPEMMVRTRPFRALHQTISHAGLVSVGNLPHPGEISLAHRGVLFLDELLEFGTRVLEVMRQPIEDKVVTISRAQGSLTFPTNFMLVLFNVTYQRQQNSTYHGRMTETKLDFQPGESSLCIDDLLHLAHDLTRSPLEHVNHHHGCNNKKAANNLESCQTFA
jgi:hypothetical protein